MQCSEIWASDQAAWAAEMGRQDADISVCLKLQCRKRHKNSMREVGPYHLPWLNELNSSKRLGPLIPMRWTD